MDAREEEFVIPISQSTQDSTLDNNEEIIITFSSGTDGELIISTNYDILECIVEDDGDYVFPFASEELINEPENNTSNDQISIMTDCVDKATHLVDEELKTLLAEMNTEFNQQTTAIGCFQDNPRRSENENYIVFTENENENRVGSVNWCQCGNCVTMKTNIESICCREISNADIFMENLNCITDHEIFKIFCNRVDTVTVNLRSFVYTQKEPTEKDLNRCRRKTAYRSFTGWIHGYLGPGNRKPIPSCAVASVRRSFPDPDLEYLGFKARTDHAAEFMAL